MRRALRCHSVRKQRGGSQALAVGSETPEFETRVVGRPGRGPQRINGMVRAPAVRLRDHLLPAPSGLARYCQGVPILPAAGGVGNRQYRVLRSRRPRVVAAAIEFDNRLEGHHDDLPESGRTRGTASVSVAPAIHRKIPHSLRDGRFAASHELGSLRTACPRRRC
jgi:hypothetical protein